MLEPSLRLKYLYLQIKIMLFSCKTDENSGNQRLNAAHSYFMDWISYMWYIYFDFIIFLLT